MSKKYKGNICRATKTQKKDVKRICKRFGKKSQQCKTMKRRIC